MTDPARSTPSRYGPALVAVLLAVGARLSLHPTLGHRQPFVTLVLALIFTTWYSGPGPSLLVLGLGAIAGAYFQLAGPEVPAIPWFSNFLGVGFYLVVGTAIVLFGEAGRAARHRLEAEVAERRRAEERLRDSEQRFARFMQYLPGLAWIKDARGRYVYANDAAERAFGVRGDDLLGRPDDDLFPPETAAQFRENDRKALQAGAGIQVVETMAHPDGVVHHSLVSKFPMPGPDAEATTVGGMAIDITDRVRAEEATRASEGRFRQLADAMPLMVWVTRPDRSVEYINRRWLDYTGQTWEQALGPEGWPAAIHPDDLGRVREASVRAHALGETFQAEYRLREASGAYRWHLGRSVPIFDEQGRQARRFGAAADVHDLRRAEDASRLLAEAGAMLSALVDEASTLGKIARLTVPTFADWCAVDLAGEGGSLDRLVVVHVDPSKVELAHELHRRYPPDPDAPFGVTHVLRTGESEWAAEITDEMLVAGARDEAQLAILRDLGLGSYACVPLKGRGGVLGAITFVAEAGRRYGPEDLRLAEDLASRAAIAVENARLYAELREADRLKDEFLATLAHELRNPLAPIRNVLTLMRGQVAPEIEPDRSMVERQVVHLSRLVDDLMDVARIKKGKIELRREPVELAPILRQAVEAVRPMAEGRGHGLALRLPDGPIRLVADPTRLEQVVHNLLTNAAKYTEPGGRISLEALREGDDAVIRVRDTGIGIPPKMLPRVFEMFAQVEGSSGRSGGGLGIGLGLARSLVELHGGAISARSEGAGRGSEFEVRLPAAPAVADGPPSAASPKVEAAPIRRRILVVDDNVDAAVSLARLLGRLHGQDVKVAHDGPSALEVAQGFRPEVVILDIGMPGMDGYEVARRLRARPESESAYLVALTGWGQRADRDRSREAGFDRHLVKPVDPDQLGGLLDDADGPRS